MIGINLKVQDSVKEAGIIVNEMGRLLYLTPLYQALVGNGYKTEAMAFYKQAEAFYSPLARNAVRSILGIKNDMEEIKPLKKLVRAKY